MRFAIYIVQIKQNIYRACCPSLPGCSAVGASPAEAQQKMSEAIVWYLAGLNAAPPERLELQLLENTADSDFHPGRFWKAPAEPVFHQLQ